MPELPEVETIKLQLGKFLIGHTIESIVFNYRKKFDGDEKFILNSKIINTRRFGKVVCIDFENGYSMLTHVKMTGQFIYIGPNLPKPSPLSTKVIGGVPGKHTHIIFKLDKNGTLYFNDVRKFGWIKIVESGQVIADRFIEKLGPEIPVANNTSSKILTLDLFKLLLSKSSRPIKLVIMDQEKMGGVGNIYANDALWLARVNPRMPARQLDGETARQLYEAIITVLKAGLKYGGASELAFVTPDGAEGEYQNHTLTYGHTGEICPNCKKAKFEKYFLGGRGTYVCPVCQR